MCVSGTRALHEWQACVQYLELHRFLVLSVLEAPGEVAVMGREVVHPRNVAQPTQADAAAVTFLKFKSNVGRAQGPDVPSMHHIFENTTFWCVCQAVPVAETTTWLELAQSTLRSSN